MRPGAGRASTSGRARGFTLIELLVVIAVIAVLVGILLPAMAGARRTARSVVCLSNLRGLQHAQVMYADAFNGFLIDVGLPHGTAATEEAIARSWITVLSEYYGSPLAIRSPGDRSPYWPPELGGSGASIAGTFRRTSYGMNNWLSRTFNPGVLDNEPFDRLSRIPNPSATIQFLLMTEQGEYAVSDHTHVEGWGDVTDARSMLRAASIASREMFLNKWGGPPRSGRGISNYGFVDGHARSAAFEEVYAGLARNNFNPLTAH